MAPATMVFNVGEMDNAIAFRTNGDDGFFVQGFYSNGSSSEETEYGWSNNNHVIQAAFGWTGQSLRIGTVLNWERPSHTDGTKPRKTKRPAFISSGATILAARLFQPFSIKAAMIGESAVHRTWPI